VLQDIRVVIEPGATVALVGATGSGKTTLVNLLARLYPLEKGQIRINGYNIEEVRMESLRDCFGFVTQEAFLFSDTLHNNIAFSRPDAPEEAVVQAADLAAFREEVAEFPKGFQTLLGERGINLSGGQKQRAAIARAVLKDPQVLVLDDALSSVDTRTEEEILNNLRTFTRGRTVILIAHRISTLRNADRILVLHRGRIVEQGTHDELIRLGGRYADLDEQQRLKSEIEEM
jgi:ATP-binding cassette subfamily B protein